MAAYSILVLPGDGVGPEVTNEAIKVVEAVSSFTKLKINIKTALLGGCSIDKYGVSLTDETLREARAADAVLMGAVGGPKWGAGSIRPEEGILTLRKELNCYANLRPCNLPSSSLINHSVLKPEVIKGTDFVIVRENCGGAYFGTKVETKDFASDPWSYSRAEIERVVRVAGQLALIGSTGSSSGDEQGREPRNLQVISCDKANVLASSRLWRRVTCEVFAKEFPTIKLSHQLADSAAMLMIKSPRSFNGIVVMDNTFGDILSDVSAVIPGSLGLLPSASLDGAPRKEGKKVKGLYEPVHGSAPDIAGKGIANPVAAILSAAMMFRYSFCMPKEAAAIEKAVERVLDAKDIGGLELRTADLGGTVTTKQMGDAIRDVLVELLTASQL